MSPSSQKYGSSIRALFQCSPQSGLNQIPAPTVPMQIVKSVAMAGTSWACRPLEGLSRTCRSYRSGPATIQFAVKAIMEAVKFDLITLGDHLPDPHTHRYHESQAERHRMWIDM